MVDYAFDLQLVGHHEKKRLFEARLSLDNINFLLADCPELECVSGRDRDIILRLYSNSRGRLPREFIAKYDGEYHASIGVFLDKGLDRTEEAIEFDLIRAINESELIPMIFRTGVMDVNVGYVKMRVIS